MSDGGFTMTAPIASGRPTSSLASEEIKGALTVRTRVSGEEAEEEEEEEEDGRNPCLAASVKRESQAAMFAV